MLSSTQLGMAAIGLDVLVVRPWPAWDSRPSCWQSAAAFCDAQQLGVALGAVDIAVAAGVELDHRRAELHRRLELARVGLDEQRDADAGVAQAARPAASGDCAARPRRARPRWSAPRASRARCRRRAGDGASAIATISSVAAISRLSGRSIASIRRAMSSSEMWRRSSRRWAVMPSAPAFGRELGGAHRIGVGVAARVAHGGDVVDVDAETLAGKRGHLLTHSVESQSDPYDSGSSPPLGGEVG